MRFNPIKTRVMEPGEDILEFIISQCEIEDKALLFISTKLFSYSENRFLDCHTKAELKKIAKSEAERFYDGTLVDLSLKKGLLVANSGVDESNSMQGTVVLWPKDPQKSLDELHKNLKFKLGIKNLGLVMVDTICNPLRDGVSGAAVCVSGFEIIDSKIGKKDIYGRELKFAKINVGDSLAATANYLMGEADEKTPLVIAKDTNVKFRDTYYNSIEKVSMQPEDCMFAPIFKF